MNKTSKILAAILVFVLAPNFIYAWEKSILSMPTAKQHIDQKTAAELLNRPKLIEAEKIFKLGNIIMIVWDDSYMECVSIDEKQKNGYTNDYINTDFNEASYGAQEDSDEFSQEERDLNQAQEYEDQQEWFLAAMYYDNIPGYEEKAQEMRLNDAQKDEDQCDEGGYDGFCGVAGNTYLFVGHTEDAIRLYKKGLIKAEENGDNEIADDYRKKIIAIENGWNGKGHIDDWWHNGRDDWQYKSMP